MRNPVALVQKYSAWYGPLRWPIYVISRLAGRPAVITVQHRGIPHPMLMRTHSTDLKMYHSIFTQPQYELPLAREPEIVFDCGGNVGYAAVWFAVKYPTAQIYSIEPEPLNFRLLVDNTKYYPRIVPLLAAIWSEDTVLNVVDVDLGSCGFETQQPSDNQQVVGRTLAFSLGSLMKRLKVGAIDLLKVDIEAAEAQLFSGDCAWLANIGVLVVEFHDERCPGLRERIAVQAPDYFAFKGHFDENEIYAKAEFVNAATSNGFWLKL